MDVAERHAGGFGSNVSVVLIDKLRTCRCKDGASVTLVLTSCTHGASMFSHLFRSKRALLDPKFSLVMVGERTNLQRTVQLQSALL